MISSEIKKSLTEHIAVLRKRSAHIAASDRVEFTSSLVLAARLVMPEASVRKNLEDYYNDLLEAAKSASVIELPAITASALLVAEFLLDPQAVH